MRTALIAIGVLAAIWLAAIAVLLLAGRRTLARELATLVPNLLLLFKDLIGDPRVPRSSRMMLVVAAVWIASPIDLIPEFIPVLGPLDDAIVAALVLRFVLARAGREVIQEHWRGDPATLRRILRVAGVGDGDGDGVGNGEGHA